MVHLFSAMRSALHRAAALLLAISPIVVAAEGFSGSISFLTQNKYLGGGQNYFENKSFDPTVQMTLLYQFKNGIYLSNWMTNTKIMENNRLESFASLGYQAPLGPGVYDLSISYDVYPGQPDASTVYIGASYYWSYYALKWMTVVSEKYTGMPDGRWWQAMSISAEKEIHPRWSINGDFGRLQMTRDLKAQGARHKMFYSVGLDYRMENNWILGAKVSGAWASGPSVGYPPDYVDKRRLIMSITKKF